MERKLIREGVEIRLNCEVTEEMLKNEFAGYEVIAGTGADPIVVNAFTAFKHCVTADDILAGKAFAGRKVVVIGGGSVGCERQTILLRLSMISSREIVKSSCWRWQMGSCSRNLVRAEAF